MKGRKARTLERQNVREFGNGKPEGGEERVSASTVGTLPYPNRGSRKWPPCSVQAAGSGCYLLMRNQLDFHTKLIHPFFATGTQVPEVNNNQVLDDGASWVGREGGRGEV